MRTIPVLSLSAVGTDARGDDVLAQAKCNLSRFIAIQAAAMADLVGFGWIPSGQAPTEFLQLRRAYLASSLTGRPLPVSDQHSKDTIYSGPETNFAFRFWHDLTHVRLDRGFDLDGEIEVAVSHLDVLRAAGWGPGTAEFELLHADTLGQTLCGATSGDFPADQSCFALRSVTNSLAFAIKAEIDPK